MMQPIVPFEPIQTNVFPKGAQWIAQVKWDGVRMLTYYDGSSVQLINRRLNIKTSQYPELTEIEDYCDAQSVILDGEIISLKNGMPSFQRVMQRDGVKKAQSIKTAQRRVPVIYMIFDILFYNGHWVTHLSLKERQVLLHTMIIQNEQVHLVPNQPDAPALFQATAQLGLEGIVIKDLNSSYTINGRDSRWQKKKHYQDLNAVIGGVTYRGSVVNAILLGLYDPSGDLWYIGHAGTGKLSQQDWQQVTQQTAPLIMRHSPFQNKPERNKGAIWIQPKLTVKVKFLEWTSSRTLRQPSIQALNTVELAQCTLEQLK
jgi:bifunctional non-homologous end joining protein LigD